MPSAEQLAFFSKEPSVADELVGRSIWFNWGAVGWLKGEITRRNHNKSYKVDEEYKNFFIFYEHDGEEVSTLLRLSEYDQFDKLSWVLLDEVPVEV